MFDKNHSHFLSLIIPVYRQERIIVKNILEIKSVLDKIRYDYEIIIVFDGIVDGSYQKIKKTKMSKVKTLAYFKNQGKSYAIRLGMKRAKGDYIMFIDSGLEIDPNGISMLIEHMEWYDADVIVGSKRHPASLVIYSWQRRILSFGYYYLVKLLFGIKVRDTQAGIKIFRKPVLEKILPMLVEKKFAGDLEMLVASDSLGFHRIYESPIKLNYAIGGISDASSLNSIKGIFIDTIAIWYRKNVLKYYK